jgi:hypothetical protein
MNRSCKKIRKHLLAFLTRQLEEDRARAVKEHLTGCPLCSREAEELQAAWELMGTPLPGEQFRDIASGVLARIKRAEHKTGLLGKFVIMLVRTPSPALGALIALLALPAGIYLGKNLYLNTAYALHSGGEITAQAEDLPLDVFYDFPDNTIGSVYVNLDESG